MFSYSNILGSVTCTVSLIVDNSKKQEAQTDFRNVLRKSSSGKSPTSPPPQPSNQDVDFRSVLRKTSEKQEAVVSSQSDSDDQKFVDKIIKLKLIYFTSSYLKF